MRRVAFWPAPVTAVTFRRRRLVPRAYLIRKVRLRERAFVENVFRRVAAAVPFGRAERNSTRTRQPFEQRVLTIRRPLLRAWRRTLTRSLSFPGFAPFLRAERGRMSRDEPLLAQMRTVSPASARAFLTAASYASAVGLLEPSAWAMPNHCSRSPVSCSGPSHEYAETRSTSQSVCASIEVTLRM